MSTWDSVRNCAISFIPVVHPTHGHNALNTYIMATGYRNAPNPHSCTADLFYVYAASLVNSGGPSPSPDSFGEMIRAAISHFLSRNRLSTVPTVQCLAANCRNFLLSGHLIGGNFHSDISRISSGVCKQKGLMDQLLNSIVQFADWLLNNYNGSANTLHACFRLPVLHGVVPHTQVESWLLTLSCFTRMGIATAANFVKDSQISGFSGYSPTAMKAYLAGWFVKPDMHVIRLMAYVTGRYPLAPSTSANPLITTKINKILPLFDRSPMANFVPHHITATRPDIRRIFAIIRDIHSWAHVLHTSALEIDRVLYLIVSGRYIASGLQAQLLPGPAGQVTRYQTYFTGIGRALASGHPRMS